MRREIMPKPRTETGGKNYISDTLKGLREGRGMSQRRLASEFQLRGYDIGKDVITRIETNKRYVTDIEIRAIMEVFHVSANFLLMGGDEEE